MNRIVPTKRREERRWKGRGGREIQIERHWEL